MVKIRKYANFIERFLHGPGGQRFFNFAYSIGAAIVIWGALFKILHLPGGNLLLCIGMGTEIAMFILTAFDRPPKEYAWEEVFPVLDSKNPDERPDFKSGSGIIITGDVVAGDGTVSPDRRADCREHCRRRILRHSVGRCARDGHHIRWRRGSRRYSCSNSSSHSGRRG